MPAIGYFSSQARDYDAPRLAVMRQSLAEAGYIEGKTVAIEYHWVEGDYDRLAGQAAEFMRQRVAVIFAGSLPAALAIARKDLLERDVALDHQLDELLA